MKKIVFKIRLISKTSIAMLLVFGIVLISCDFIDELPETNSIVDETPPTAFFTFTSGVEVDNFTEVLFANQSSNATNFIWDLGNGETSEARDPEVIYPGEGSFTVTLTVNDALGQTASYSETIELIEPEPPTALTPVIAGAAFDDFDGVCGIEGDPDSRDCWRISGATIHQTSSNGDRDEDGNRTRAAKYPPGQDLRVSYQAIVVSPNQRYELVARYALEADGDIIRLNVVDGHLSDFSEFASATILAFGEGTINDGNDGYNTIRIPFETGANENISLVFNHADNVDDTYIDNVSVVPIFN